MRVGVLVVRAWVEGEDEQDQHLRARVTRTDDVVDSRELTAVATSVDEVCDIVRAWLERVSAS